MFSRRRSASSSRRRPARSSRRSTSPSGPPRWSAFARSAGSPSSSCSPSSGQATPPRTTSDAASESGSSRRSSARRRRGRGSGASSVAASSSASRASRRVAAAPGVAGDVPGWAIAVFARLGVVVAVVAVVGDLVESTFKRSCAVKDSGRASSRARRAPRPARLPPLRVAGRCSSRLPGSCPVGAAMTAKKRIALMGATGSIGDSALSVVGALPGPLRDRHDGRRLEPRQAPPRDRGAPPEGRLGEERGRTPARVRLEFPGIAVGWGEQGLVDVATHPDVDVVLGALVGSAGLVSSYDAAKLGKTLALANKETLVVAGEPLMARPRARRAPRSSRSTRSTARSTRRSGAGAPSEVRRLVLTASGGPFRTRPLETFGSDHGRGRARATRPGRWGRRSRSTRPR